MGRPKLEIESLGSEVANFLRMKSKSTAQTYRWGFKYFLDHYKEKHGKEKTMKNFLDSIFENMKKPREEQKPRIIESEFVDFIEYLKKIKLSRNTINVYIAALQNFLKYYNIMVSMSFVGNVPKPIAQKKNHKHEWTIENIKSFVSQAKTYRDKALILCLFQSGLGLYELINLNYSDIQNEFEKDIVPIHLRLHRKKTGIEFRTFFGRDAVKYLKLYLETRSDLKEDSPLFTKWGSNTKRITSVAIELKFRQIAEKLDFIKESEMKGYNPCRPHSLRSAFRSQLTSKIADSLIEFFMGHRLDEQIRAYINLPTEQLRDIYQDAEKYLSIEKTSRNELIEQKTVDLKTKEEIVELKNIIRGLTNQYDKSEAENIELKSRMARLELEHTEFKKEILQSIETFRNENKISREDPET